MLKVTSNSFGDLETIMPGTIYRGGIYLVYFHFFRENSRILALVGASSVILERYAPLSSLSIFTSEVMSRSLGLV